MTRHPLTLLALLAALGQTAPTPQQAHVERPAQNRPCASQMLEFPLPPEADHVTAMAVDREGNLIVAGQTFSADFPTTADARKRVCGTDGDAFVSIYAPEGELRYSTCLGGNTTDWVAGVAPAAGGAVWVLAGTKASEDGPDRCINCGLGRPVLYLVTPGSPELLLHAPRLDWARSAGIDAIAAGIDGSLWVLATATAADVPTVNAWQPVFGGALDILLARYAPGAPEAAVLTYLGGRGGDSAIALATAPDGDAIVQGWFDADFPLVRQAQEAGGSAGGPGLARLDASGRWVEYATHFNPFVSGGRIAADGAGNVVVVGKPAADPSHRHYPRELVIGVLADGGRLRGWGPLETGLDVVPAADTAAWLEHVAVVDNGAVVVAGFYFTDDLISGGLFVTMTDASGAALRQPLVVRRPSGNVLWVEAVTSRGRDLYAAAYEWPPYWAQRKVIRLRLQPGAVYGDGTGAGPGRR